MLRGGGGKKQFIDINRSQKILKGVGGIKSILWILAILRGCMVINSHYDIIMYYGIALTKIVRRTSH